MKLSNITRYRWGKIAHNHSHPQPWFRRSQHVATDHTHKRSTQFPVLQQNHGNCQSTCSIHQCQCPHSRLEDISSLAEVALRDKKRTREEFWEQAIRVRSWSRLEWWSLTWKSWFWRWRCCLMQMCNSLWRETLGICSERECPGSCVALGRWSSNQRL